MSIGANIRRIRKIRGMTQRELGEKLGVTQAAIGQCSITSSTRLQSSAVCAVENPLPCSGPT